MSREEIINIIRIHFAKKHKVNIENIDINDFYISNGRYTFDYYVYFDSYGEDLGYEEERIGWISENEIIEDHRDILLNRLDI